MATRKITAGDPFFLDGQDYVVVDHPTKPDELIMFASLKLVNVEIGDEIVKRPGRVGVCLKREVIWHTKLEKWTMMGRLLSVEDKAKFTFKNVEMPWGNSLPGWSPRADDQEIVRVMIEKEEI